MHKWIVAGGLAAVIVAASACQKVEGSKVPQDGDLGQVPECPHEWPRIFGGNVSPNGDKAPPLPPGVTSGPLAWLTAGLSDESSVARTRTNVPEYHDCQRMREQDAGAPVRYGALAAMFAADSLERRADDSIVAPRVIGEVLSDSEYPTALRKGLHLPRHRARRAGLTAWMVPVGIDEQRVQVDGLADVDRCDLLTVRVASSKFPGDEIPPVARWDWDESTHVQFIGIRCGEQWCEIEPKAGSGRRRRTAAI